MKHFTEVNELILPEHLSPYLKCMLAVAKKLRIDPDNQVNKASLEEELKEVWRKMRGAEPEPTDLSWMAI